MSIETREKTINGRNITVTQFPGRKSLQYKIQIVKLIGGAFAHLLSGTKSVKDFTTMDVSILVPAIEKLAAQLNPNEFVDFVLTLFSMTRIDGKEINATIFDMEFGGDLALMYRVLAFVLEVNYGSFFAPGAIGRTLSPAESPIVPK